MNKHTKKEKSTEEIEVNPSLFGDHQKSFTFSDEDLPEDLKPPKILKLKMLKSGFFFKRNVLLTEAIFEHCYRSGNSLFTVNLVEGDINSSRRMGFVLTEAEKVQMKEFLADNKVPFELELVIRLGVPMKGPSPDEVILDEVAVPK